jgi:hypothetical protein
MISSDQVEIFEHEAIGCLQPAQRVVQGSEQRTHDRDALNRKQRWSLVLPGSRFFSLIHSKVRCVHRVEPDGSHLLRASASASGRALRAAPSSNCEA